jgi:hypothetical protein
MTLTQTKGNKMAIIENNAHTELTTAELAYAKAKADYYYHVEEYHAYLESEFFYGPEALDYAANAAKARHKKLADYYANEMSKAALV